MPFPMYVNLAPNVVTAVDLSAGLQNGGSLLVRVGDPGPQVWVRGDGGTPAAYGPRSAVNWWTQDEGFESGRIIYVDLSGSDRTLRLLSQAAVSVQIAKVNPNLNLTTVNGGFGVATAAEYPQVGAGVTSIALSEPRRPGSPVRVDFPLHLGVNFSVTADGTTPSLTDGATNEYGRCSHLVYLPETAPESALKVYAAGSNVAWPVRIRVQTVLGTKDPEL